ncbi:kinase-like domain-containing protein [Microdochium trichocladiopsis]|uniref:Kinase-like domain-containing protein n=1 Tax=Microdochium trichocladiopsis TaxID=1682393 RepID=A0A9P9BSV3_9PEZI|nr:kinase-like domain-containing protein [Microdochium trichocladiopsis]KAH7035235.1 kinase-like domain-containing protein [Microdochium trichocladiopsis]
MHNVQYGYPSPPASPAYDNKCAYQQPQFVSNVCQPRYIPVAPEERLGKFLGDSLQLVGIIGTGAYGVVYLALDVKTGIQYAVKTLSKYNADGTPLDRRQVAFQHQELRLHYLASAHPNVVSMHKIVDDPDCIYVVLEYCPEGDLFLNITERGQYVGNDELAKSVFLQILDAVEHCHTLGVYHRDLKPENILVSNNGATVKLADFGLATSSERSEDYGCGSTFYMSPECLNPSSRRPFYYCPPNDVWSLGVILVNLTCGRNPWKQASVEDSAYRAFVTDSDFLRTILPLSDDLNHILGRIFTPNPDQRITLSELRNAILAAASFTIPPPPLLSSHCLLPSPPPRLRSTLTVRRPFWMIWTTPPPWPLQTRTLTVSQHAHQMMAPSSRAAPRSTRRNFSMRLPLPWVTWLFRSSNSSTPSPTSRSLCHNMATPCALPTCLSLATSKHPRRRPHSVFGMS